MEPVLSSHARKGILGYVGVPAFLALWAFLSYAGIVNALVLPPPHRVVTAIGDIGMPLLLHIGATVTRILAGFLGAILAGASIGILMQYSRRFYAVADSLVETWRPVPPVALIPFFILIFGFSEVGRAILVMLGATLVVIVTIVEAMDRVPPAQVRFGLVAGLSRTDLFRLVLIPASIPSTKAGFRIALALAITLVIVSEFLGSRYGLGYLISVSKVTLTTPTIILCVILLGLIGFTLDLAVRRALGFFTREESSSREAVR